MTDPANDAPMIFRPVRPLETGCRTCLRSDLYCQAVRELDRQPCCPRCSHGPDDN